MAPRSKPAPARDDPRARPLRVGVSACLLGENVRYDGGHKHSRWLTDVLGSRVEFVRVCPEVEIGLPVPRPTIRLVAHPGGPRLVEPVSGADLTERMRTYALRRADALARQDLDGFVLKADSPSCGPARVKVWPRGGGPPRRAGRGLFAEAVAARMPLLPVEDEGRLEDPAVRGHFLVRLLAHRRVREFFAGPWTPRDLEAFHARETPLLRACGPESRRALESLVAAARDRPRREIADAYAARFLGALARPATPRRRPTGERSH